MGSISPTIDLLFNIGIILFILGMTLFFINIGLALYGYSEELIMKSLGPIMSGLIYLGITLMAWAFISTIASNVLIDVLLYVDEIIPIPDKITF